MITLALLIVLATGTAASITAALIGGWCLATWAGWLLGEHRAPRGSSIATLIAATGAVACFVLASHPGFWSAP